MATWGAVDVEAERRPVIGQGEIRPRVGRQRPGPVGVRVRAGERATTRWLATVAGGAFQVVVVYPPCRSRPARRQSSPPDSPTPPTSTHSTNATKPNPEPSPADVDPLKLNAPAILTRHPGRIRHRPVIATPRPIRHRRPRPLIKRESSDQARRGRRSRGDGSQPVRHRRDCQQRHDGSPRRSARPPSQSVHIGSFTAPATSRAKADSAGAHSQPGRAHTHVPDGAREGLAGAALRHVFHAYGSEMRHNVSRHRERLVSLCARHRRSEPHERVVP